MSEREESEPLFPWETDEGAASPADASADAPTSPEPASDDASPAPASDAAGDAAAEAGSAAGPAGDDEADADEARFDVLDTELGRRAAERAAAALRDRPIAPKEYYAISEVCDLVGLKPHVLRYWETQFQLLNPSKNRSGNRVYQRKEIKLVMLVKHLLYDEKYTVDGARAKLDQLRRTGELTDATARTLDREMIAALRADLSELTTLLMPAKPE